MNVPEITVSHPKTAIAVVPSVIRGIRSRSPSSVSSRSLKLQRPASPPPKASRKTAPKPMPWRTVHSSRSLNSISAPFLSRVGNRFSVR